MKKTSYLRFIMAASLSVALTACGGNRALVGQDNSVDYRSAVELPPLVKTLPAPSAAPAPVSASVPTSVPTSAPVQSTQVVETVQANSAAPSAANAAPNNLIRTAQTQSSRGATRLLIDAPLANAWQALIEQAKLTGMSIFSRNVADSRMFIGCGEIPDGASSERSGRWTFFKRDSNSPAAEYCSLKLTENGGKTRVVVLNRAGEEVASRFSQPIISKLVGE